MTRWLNHTTMWWLCHIPCPTSMWIVWARFVEWCHVECCSLTCCQAEEHTEGFGSQQREIHFLHVGHMVQQGKLDYTSYLPRGRMFWDDSLPHGSLLAATFSQMQQKVEHTKSLTFRTEKRKSLHFWKKMCLHRPALCWGRSRHGLGSHWADDEGVFIITILGQFRLAGWSFPCSGKSHSPGQI